MLLNFNFMTKLQDLDELMRAAWYEANASDDVRSSFTTDLKPTILPTKNSVADILDQ